MRDPWIDTGSAPASPPLASPIPTHRTEADPQRIEAAAGAGVVLADLTGILLVSLLGTGLAEGLGRPVGQVAAVEGGWWAQLTDDQALWVLPTTASDARSAAERLRPRTKGLVIATDESHGLGTIGLAGTRAQAVLRKVTGLDLTDRQMGDRRVAQTSLANVHARLLRLDQGSLPAYWILVGRSVGAYVWEILLEAADEFDKVVIEGRRWLDGELT